MTAPPGFHLLAQLSLDSLLRSWRMMDSSYRGYLVLFGALLLVLLPPLIWALYFRKPRRQPHAWLRVSAPPRGAASLRVTERVFGRRTKRHKHHQGHDHRNPAGAANGGPASSAHGGRASRPVS
jgi:hypothetical protein